MRGHLLDTNVIEFWFNPRRKEHASVCNAIAALGVTSPLYTSVVVIGEIAFGCHAVAEDPTAALRQLDALLRRAEFPDVLDVRKSTTEIYGDLRGRLFKKYAPKVKRKKSLRPEQLIDPLTSLELGIQENDLWIAAQALERNLVLVSGDKMDRIRSIAQELTVENWAEGGASAAP